MAVQDPFDFGAASAEASIDLSLFAPKARPTDVGAAKVAAEVAESAGFSRRTPAVMADRKALGRPAAPAKGAKRRVNLQDLLGLDDRYPDTERAQVNMLVPVPVVVRWRELCKASGGPAWAVFERAVEALEAQTTASGDRA